MKTMFETTAQEHKNVIKFVAIDVSELFKLAEHCAITETPTLSLFHNREEIDYKEKLTVNAFEQELQLLIQSTPTKCGKG